MVDPTVRTEKQGQSKALSLVARVAVVAAPPGRSPLFPAEP